jgi:hypothetical protein
MFLIADDQKISAESFCFNRAEESACKSPDLGVRDFDQRLETALKLEPLCNGFPIILAANLDEAGKYPSFVMSNIFLYVDYYPGQSQADWSLWYNRGSGIFDLIGKSQTQIMRPLNRGNIGDIAAEACSLADLKRRPR